MGAISEHEDVRIIDVKFILPLDQELRLLGVALWHSKHKETQLFLIFVG